MSENTPKEGNQGIGGAGDLFDAMGAEGEQFKPKKEEKQQAQKPATGGTGGAGKTATKTKPKSYPEGTLVVHQGDHKTLDKALTEKEVYDLFNDDHPDVSMDRYELLEDKEKKRYWFKAKGFKKGGRPEKDGRPLTVLTAGTVLPGENAPSVCRVLGGDTVYEWRRTPLGSFIAPIESAVEVHPGFYSNRVPKAPVRLLASVIEAFRDRTKHETVVEIFYNRHDGSFKPYWPPQRNATAGSVEYDPLPETEDVFRYMNIHSHNTMHAFFSRTDDEYETATGIYGVIGRVEDDRPEALFRFSCGGLFGQLGVEDLFDDPELARSLITDPLPVPEAVRPEIREARDGLYGREVRP